MNDRLSDSPLLRAAQALRDRALEAESVNELAFSIANDLYPLLHYRQALVFAARGSELELLCVSGLAKPVEDSPYLVWLDRTVRWLGDRLDPPQPQWIARACLQPPPEVEQGWAEWWPAGLWCVPLRARDGRRLGVALYLLDEPPAEPLAALLEGVCKTWAHCWAALTRGRPRRRWRPGVRGFAVLALLAAALLLVPVRQSVLAPAEIASRQALIVSSPIDGVIRQLHVRPNQPVEAGTLLFSLEESSLRSRADVLAKQVAVADAELMAASQRAFDNPQSKGEIGVLGGRAQQRRAELEAVQAQLQRTQVHAPAAGIAVYADPNDWLGKPVVTGERILLVADPAQPAMRIQLPVADAIALEPGAEVTLFLTAYPLQPLRGRILETSYQARVSDEGVASYRLLASIDDAPVQARLGLHGTAKLHGERVTLGYYLLRRPLAALRAWAGW